MQITLMRDYMADSISPFSTLDQLPRGASARVTAIASDGAQDSIGQRLLEMGFEVDAIVEITHLGPLSGDPLAVRVGNMTVALRRAEAARISVQVRA